MNIHISVLNGRMKGRKYPVAEGKTVQIGRGSSADIVIVDSMSSRLHCEVSNNGTEFILKDLGSSNGTYKDDEAIKQVKVYSGDRFKIGSTVFEIRGLVMVEPGKTRETPPDELMKALDAIPNEEPEQLRTKAEPEIEEEEEIPNLEEAPPPPVSADFDPVPQDFQVHESSPIPGSEAVPDPDEKEEEEAEEEEEKPAGDRTTVEFRRTVESADEGDEESSLAILEPVPGFDYEDDLLCIRCGDLMDQKDIDRALVQKEGKGYVCPKCVRAEVEGQMSGLGFGNLEVVDVGTIDDELLEEMKKEGTTIAEMLEEALRSQKEK